MMARRLRPIKRWISVVRPSTLPARSRGLRCSTCGTSFAIGVPLRRHWKASGDEPVELTVLPEMTVMMDANPLDPDAAADYARQAAHARHGSIPVPSAPRWGARPRGTGSRGC